MKNLVFLTGFTGQDAEVKVFDSGQKVARFNIAVSNDYFDKDKKEWVKKDSTWVSIQGFGSMVEKMESLKKGSKVSIQGKLEIRSYQDKEGVEKSITQVRANSIAHLVHNPQPSKFKTPQMVEDPWDKPIDESTKSPF